MAEPPILPKPAAHQKIILIQPNHGNPSQVQQQAAQQQQPQQQVYLLQPNATQQQVSKIV